MFYKIINNSIEPLTDEELKTVIKEDNEYFYIMFRDKFGTWQSICYQSIAEARKQL